MRGTIRSGHAPPFLDFRTFGKTRGPWGPLRCHSRLDERRQCIHCRRNKLEGFRAILFRRNIHSIRRPSPSFLSVTLVGYFNFFSVAREVRINSPLWRPQRARRKFNQFFFLFSFFSIHTHTSTFLSFTVLC